MAQTSITVCPHLFYPHNDNGVDPMSVPIETRNNRLKMIIHSLHPGGTKNFSTIIGIGNVSRPWVIGIQDQFLGITKDGGTGQHLDQLTLKVPSEDLSSTKSKYTGLSYAL